jgi:hypothetical protein
MQSQDQMHHSQIPSASLKKSGDGAELDGEELIFIILSP